MGAMEEIAKQIGCSSGYVARALRYNSETAPSEIRIRDVARKKFGGKEIKIIYTV